MKRADIDRIREIIADKLEIDVCKISVRSDLDRDLGGDSLDEYELGYALEEEFGIVFSMEILNEYADSRDHSVKAIVRLVAKLLKEKETETATSESE
ncbi:MAG: acyl carrier protein [Rickettsiales bacterium]|jgi:acyl carrier protein|nr:acyl carrier protein [Rickettsiales bacterium]